MPRSADAFAGAAQFDCQYCIRPEEIPDLPTLGEDGHRFLGRSEILAIYNQHRWEHLHRDFDTAGAVQEHLEKRARYWTKDNQTGLEMAMLTVRADIEHWQWSHDLWKEQIPKQQELETT